MFSDLFRRTICGFVGCFGDASRLSGHARSQITTRVFPSFSKVSISITTVSRSRRLSRKLRGIVVLGGDEGPKMKLNKYRIGWTRPSRYKFSTDSKDLLALGVLCVLAIIGLIFVVALCVRN
jgi:hypothetical protein